MPFIVLRCRKVLFNFVQLRMFQHFYVMELNVHGTPFNRPWEM